MGKERKQIANVRFTYRNDWIMSGVCSRSVSSSVFRMRRAAQASSVRKRRWFSVVEREVDLADNAGKKTSAPQCFQKMSIVWESQNRLFRNAVLTTQVIGFLLQRWKIVQDCVAYIGKGNPVFTEKKNKK